MTTPDLSALIRTARTTGAWYLALAVAGGLGYLVVRPQLFASGDPGQTLQNLLDQPSLARTGIALELTLVATQTMAALWFFRLFRSVDTFAAGAITAFGLAQGVPLLTSAACLLTAFQVSVDSTLALAGDAAGTAQLLYTVSDNLWTLGTLFFGLWLIPMGWLVLRSGWMPRPLGWILIPGGVGYVVSAFLGSLAPDAGIVADALAYPATVGELWMVGYLLTYGVRRSRPSQPHTGIPAAPAAR